MLIAFSLLSLLSDYIQCPYCKRRFNETAASRHINFCKDQESCRVFDPAQTAARLASRAQVSLSPQVLAPVPLSAQGKQVEFAREPKSPVLRTLRIRTANLHGTWLLLSNTFQLNSTIGCCRKSSLQGLKVLRLKT